MSAIPGIVNSIGHIILMGFCFACAISFSEENPMASVCWLVALVLLFLEPVLLV